MVTGFLGVPVFKFLAPSLPRVGELFGVLGELPPASAVAFVAAVATSLFDPAGVRAAAAEELKQAGA